MENKVYKIGIVRYLLTTIFGKNIQIRKEVIETKDENGDTITDSNSIDYLISISKKAVIITIPKNNNKNNRIALVVKPLKFIGSEQEIDFNKKINMYVDNEGYKWIHTKDDLGELISYFKDENKMIHLES
jgi:hypothetical protein